MYNSECKREFLKGETRNSDYMEVLISYFNLIENHENNNGKDLSNFSMQEIERFYKSIFSKSLERLIVLNNCYMRYTKYMLKKGLVADQQNHYAELDRRVLNSFLATTGSDIISKADLYKQLNRLNNACHQFLILGLFEGIYGKNYSEFYELTMDNFEGDILHLPTRNLKVSQKLISYAELSSEEYYYYKIDFGGLSNAVSETRRFIQNDKRIIKELFGTKDDDSRRGRRIQVHLDRCRRYLRCDALTAKGLRESGRVEMIKDLIKENPDKNIRDVILENREKIVKIYGNFTNNSVSAFLLKYENYLK